MVTFDSIHEIYATFKDDGGLENGHVCRVSRNGMVAACANDQMFSGVAHQVRNGLVGVVLRGICSVHYTGTTPITGFLALCADGNGNVKVGGDKKYLVLRVDEDKQMIDFLL